jgi:hypothetical protein
MARTVKFEGRTISVPDDATDDEIASIIDQPAPAAKPASREEVAARFEGVKPPTLMDRAALHTDKILKKMGDELPDWLPSRQALVDFAGGASTMGGALENAPRIQNTVNKDSGSYLLGQVADPVMAATGGKVFQAAMNAKKLANAGNILKTAIAGAGAGGATSIPKAISQASEGELGDAAATPVVSGLAGGVLGPALMPFGWLTGKAVQGAKSFAGGTEGRIRDYLGQEFNDLPKVRAAVEALRGFLPGEKPTVGQAARVAGESKLGALERGARARPSAASEFALRDEANRGAREEALKSQLDILEPAKQFRTDIAGPIYKKADAEQIVLTPELQQIMSGDMVAALRGRAGRTGGQMETNAQVAGRDFNPRSVPGQPAPRTDFAFEGQMDNVGATPGTVSVNEMQLLKSAIDDELNAVRKGLPSPTGLTGVNAKELGEARRQLIGEVSRLSPTWKEAREQFADKSVPVNQRAIMEHLYKVLRSPMAGEGAAGWNAAMNDIPKTFERATGMPRFASPEQAMESLSPLGQRTVKNITSSLERQADVAKNWTAPQSALSGMENPMDAAAGATPNIMSLPVTVAKKVAQKLGSGLDKKAQAVLDQSMLDPKKFVELIDATPASERLPLLQSMQDKVTDPAIKGAIQSYIARQF